MSSVRSPKIEDRRHRFKALACLLEHMADKEGVEIRPFVSFELPFFSALPEGQQDHVLWQLETIVNVAQRLQAQGERINHSRKLTWGFFKHTRLRPPTEVLEKIDNEDCVDIYNQHHQLIFANLRFFQILSYSLEDLYCRPWLELFSRDIPEVHTMLCQVAEEVMNGKHLTPVDLAFVPTHGCFETCAEIKTVAQVRPRWFSPIFEGRRVAGYLCINTVVTPASNAP